ncbi:hypothetical protein PHISCL_06250 [Aspergillus sclerotialis]|uniref:Uncharacterized protein n=1 Tax=Aspergillus sclerotialis TaxID=2070753 RepID=A0A3A2ZE37_9EURO|nr:hypothetical protein PHISCL_06250 [Aspergillus sclerotialis]
MPMNWFTTFPSSCCSPTSPSQLVEAAEAWDSISELVALSQQLPAIIICWVVSTLRKVGYDGSVVPGANATLLSVPEPILEAPNAIEYELGTISMLLVSLPGESV